jgi:hypothetical protein
VCSRDLEAFTKKENAERKQETDAINAALRNGFHESPILPQII